MARHPQLFDLLDRPPFPHPTLLGVEHYVAILKTKQGELDALSNMTSVARKRMTRLFDVDIEGSGSGDPPARSRLPGLPEQLQVILGDQPFFLDCGTISASQEVCVGRGKARGPVPAIEYLLGECERLGLNFIPVVRPGLDARIVGLAREFSDGGRGACLRLSPSGVILRGGPGAEINRLLEIVGIEPEDTDVVIDLRYISPDAGFGARHIARLIEGLPSISRWRSLVLAGTIIPQTLAGFSEDSIRTVIRHEWLLWNELRNFRLERLPVFADYVIQNPDRLASGGPNMKANLRYSAADSVLIVRGRSVLKHGREQYRDLCARLVGRPEFRGSAFSQGDYLIERCAAGYDEPGTQTKWRGAGTAHHIQAMLEALSSLPEFSPSSSESTSAHLSPDLRLARE